MFEWLVTRSLALAAITQVFVSSPTYLVGLFDVVVVCLVLHAALKLMPTEEIEA